MRTRTILIATLVAAMALPCVSQEKGDVVETPVFRAYGAGGGKLDAHVYSYGERYEIPGFAVVLENSIRDGGHGAETFYSLVLTGGLGKVSELRKELLEIAKKINALDQRCIAKGVESLEEWEEIGVVASPFHGQRATWGRVTEGGTFLDGGESKPVKEPASALIVDFRRHEGLTQVRLRGNYNSHRVILYKWAFFGFCNELDVGKIRARVEKNVARHRTEAARKKALLSL